MSMTQCTFAPSDFSLNCMGPRLLGGTGVDCVCILANLYSVRPTTSTVCIGYKVTGCKNIAVITMEFQKITIKTCFSIVKISGKTISAIAIYRV